MSVRSACSCCVVPGALVALYGRARLISQAKKCGFSPGSTSDTLWPTYRTITQDNEYGRRVSQTTLFPYCNSYSYSDVGAATGAAAAYSDLDTFDDLMTRVLAVIDSESPLYGFSASSINFFDGTHPYWQIGKAQVRLIHGPTETCYLKVWFTDTISINDLTLGISTDTQDDPVDPYVWRGSGNPCIENPLHAVDSELNRIVNDWMDIPGPPYTEGTYQSIVSRGIRKYSFLRDYDPPDDGSANGYPTP